jgi:hypothetical protein
MVYFLNLNYFIASHLIAVAAFPAAGRGGRRQEFSFELAK